MIEEVAQDLMHDEGFRSGAYQDHLGFWTIGYGRMIDDRRGGGITQFEAHELLINDINKVIGQLDARIPWWATLPPNTQRALTNMAFQLGVNGLLCFKKMLRALQDGDFLMAQVEARDSKWYNQTRNRAERVIKMLGNTDG